MTAVSLGRHRWAGIGFALVLVFLTTDCEPSAQDTPRPKAKLTVYKIPTADSHPMGITVGPDGALWLVESATNKVARVTLAGAFTEFPIPTADSMPEDITIGTDHNLWFTEAKGRKVGRITASGAISEFAVDIPNAYPTGIVAGPDGYLWLSADATNVVRLSPRGDMTVHALGKQAVATGVGCITIGPDGNLWLAASTEAARITPLAAVTEYRFSGGSLGGVAPGKDGLWFAEWNENPAIVKSTVSGTFTEYPIPLHGIPRAFPLHVASAADGSAWFVMDSFGQFVGHLTPDGQFTEWMFSDTPETAYFNTDAAGIAVAGDGTVWFTVDNDVVMLQPD